jgi:chloride channel protein, CIC family
MLLPLLVASFLAHGFTVLTLKRSILTEKIARRGYHLSREYSVDPLEVLFVREVMRTNVVALPAESRLEDARELVRPGPRHHGQHVFPLVDDEKRLLGVMSRNHLLKVIEHLDADDFAEHLRTFAFGRPVVAFADESLRVVVYRMAESGFTRLPVVDRSDEKRLLGMVSLDDLLKARGRNLEEERTRERPFRLRVPIRLAKAGDALAGPSSRK